MSLLAPRGRSRHKASEDGLTLVELLVVVVILGILAGVVVFAVRGAGDKGQTAAVQTDERIIRTAEEVSCAQNGEYASGPDLAAKQLLSAPPEIHTVNPVPANDPRREGNCPTAPAGKQHYRIDCVTGNYPDCGVPGVPPPPVSLPRCDAFDPTPTTLPVTVPTVTQGKAQALGAEPPRFEANAGQLDPAVKFSSRGRGYTLFLTENEMVMSLRRPNAEVSDVVRMGLVGANPDPQVEGLSRAASSSNYMAGDDRSQWLTDVPHYQRVAYRSVYPGIDLVWHGDGGGLEYDFVVAPGADPNVIAEAFTGADRLSIDDEGALVISTPGGDMAHAAPVIYQDVDGSRRPVDGAYRLAGDRVGFDVGPYDLDRPLVIDPVVLSYATYMYSAVGPSDEGANAVATDADGNTYLTGYSQSIGGFPTQNAYQSVRPQDSDRVIFVSKFDPIGGLVYSTYLGAPASPPAATNVNSNNGGFAIAVDANRSAYVTGQTETATFPLVPPGELNGVATAPAFLTRLSPGGNQIEYSTRFGGPLTIGTGLTVAQDGSAVFLGGFNPGGDFPSKGTQPTQPDPAGQDAFVARFQVPADRVLKLTYAILLVGSGDDAAHGVAVDANGSAYVAGKTTSTDFLSGTQGADATAPGGGSDSFVTKLGADGVVQWSRYLGGTGPDNAAGAQFQSSIRFRAGGVAVDRDGNAYVTGTTASTDFEGKINALQGTTDAFLAKVSAAGGLVRSAYIGGSGDEDGMSVAVDGGNNVYVGGRTSSTDLVPVAQTEVVFQRTFGGVEDGFVVKRNADLEAVWATYMGGSSTDEVSGVAADPLTGVALAGKTRSSSGFPTKNALRPTKSSGVNSVFAARLVTCTATP